MPLNVDSQGNPLARISATSKLSRFDGSFLLRSGRVLLAFRNSTWRVRLYFHVLGGTYRTSG